MSCVNDSSFVAPLIECVEPELKVTHSIEQVKAMAGFGLKTFTDDIIIEGYIVSSDASGNIYKTLLLQDNYKNPTAAIQFSIDRTNLFSTYPLGRKVFVKLKGLSIAYTRGIIEIGTAVAAELQRIPSGDVSSHFFRSCITKEIVPVKITLNEIDASHLNKLIQVDNVQFTNGDLGQEYAELNSTNSIDRLIVQMSENCEVVSEINVRISGFSNFKSKKIPLGKGSITAILTKYYSDYQLLLRSEEDVEFLEERCTVAQNTESTISYEQIMNLYEDKLLEFGFDTPYVFEGYVISSDLEGNFINKLFIQEGVENSKGGFQILLDEENLHESFNVGDRVYVKLNNLYLHQVDGVYTIGFPDKETVQEIEEGAFHDYIFNSRESSTIIPRSIYMNEASVELHQNTLVTIENVQIKQSEKGKAYAFFSGSDDGSRTLQTCEVLQEINLVTHGTASFSNKKFPVTKGSITGVLYRNKSELQLQIRSLEDVDMNETYEVCDVVIPKILITEVADPQNNVSARFLELYNAGDSSVNLNHWKLNKYLNGSVTASGNGIDLSGFIIEPNGFLLIANTGFENVFNMAPEITSSLLSGNGDDVYELIDSNGETHDIYGEIGVDGSGTIWEYLDGKAIRKKTIIEPKKVFDVYEWEVFSKAKDSEQLAPENFTPNVR